MPRPEADEDFLKQPRIPSHIIRSESIGPEEVDAELPSLPKGTTLPRKESVGAPNLAWRVSPSFQQVPRHLDPARGKNAKIRIPHATEENTTVAITLDRQKRLKRGRTENHQAPGVFVARGARLGRSRDVYRSLEVNFPPEFEDEQQERRMRKEEKRRQRTRRLRRTTPEISHHQDHEEIGGFSEQRVMAPEAEAAEPEVLFPGAQRIQGPNRTLNSESVGSYGSSEESSGAENGFTIDGAILVPDEDEIQRQIHEQADARLGEQIYTVLHNVPQATEIDKIPRYKRPSCLFVFITSVLVIVAVGISLGLLTQRGSSVVDVQIFCDFCYGGNSSAFSEAMLQDLFVLDNTTCASFRMGQELLLAEDSQCTVGQALTWSSCGCPALPPVNNSNCALCADGHPAIPTTRSDSCGEDDLTFISIVGSGSADTCQRLVNDASTRCECPSDSYLTLFEAVRDLVADPAEFRDISSPRYQALDWLAYRDPYNTSVMSPSVIRERFGAVLLYFALGGPSWPLPDLNFLSDSGICSWNDMSTRSGVLCEGDRAVYVNMTQRGIAGILPREVSAFTGLRGIDFSRNALVGSLPSTIALLSDLEVIDFSFNSLSGNLSEALFLSPNLRHVNIANNEISGPFPPSFVNATCQEQFYASNNMLTGTVPDFVGKCPNLRVFEASMNNLGGSLPEFVASTASVERLVLSENDFSGTLPSSWTSLRHLREVDLSANALSGLIPEFDPSSAIELLFLQRNNFFGPIPTTLTTLPGLINLDLRGNLLSGTIPRFSGRSGSLDRLRLSANILFGPLDIGSVDFPLSLRILDLGDNVLSGTIPASIANLTSLEFILLQGNSIDGEIPTDVGELRRLQSILVNNNGLSGTLPTELGELKNLTHFFFHLNSIFGTIPTFVGNMQALETWEAGFNNLSGTIPSELGNCPHLGSLGLSGNRIGGNLSDVLEGLPASVSSLFLQDLSLSGPIPPQVGRLTNLEFLNLFGNNLVGTLPIELGSLSDLREFSWSRNRIRGRLPTEIGKLTNLDTLEMIDNLLTGTLPSEFSMLSNLRVLGISQNQFSGFPAVLTELSSLRSLYMTLNNFENPGGICESLVLAEFAVNICPETTFECPCCTHCCQQETTTCLALDRPLFAP